MTLGEFIMQYRAQHDMSIRSFASLVGMSTQQIANIERGTNNEGKPLSSTMKTYGKIAEAIGMSEKDFLNLLNDNVLINPSNEKNMPIVIVDGHTMLDLTMLNERQRNMISLLLQSGGEALPLALPKVESLLSDPIVQDDSQ